MLVSLVNLLSIALCLCSTRLDEELKVLITGKGFRVDIFRFNWENKDQIAKKFQFVFPPSLRWLGHTILSLFINREKMLQLDTQRLKDVGGLSCVCVCRC